MRTLVVLVFLLETVAKASVTECPSSPSLSACLKLADENYSARLEETEDCEHSIPLVTAAKDVLHLERKSCKRTCAV